MPTPLEYKQVEYREEPYDVEKFGRGLYPGADAKRLTLAQPFGAYSLVQTETDGRIQ
jgi:hypothetical protein